MRHTSLARIIEGKVIDCAGIEMTEGPRFDKAVYRSERDRYVLLIDYVIRSILASVFSRKTPTDSGARMVVIDGDASTGTNCI